MSGHTYTYNYSNPRCACAPRVNNKQISLNPRRACAARVTAKGYYRKTFLKFYVGLYLEIGPVNYVLSPFLSHHMLTISTRFMTSH